MLTLSVFVNAALMFSVEPMFSKLVLPFLGGTPSVWNTCLMFFQAALLVGYGYAHLSTRLLGPRRQAVVHMILLALSCVVLPLQVRAQGAPPAGGQGILWLLIVLTTSLGIPFVMLASGALVAQRWFADSGHPNSANPYFLYAASNLGSLIALLSYPLLIEPRLTLSAQRTAWSAAYVGLVVIVAASAWMVAQRGPAAGRFAEPSATPRVRITLLERAKWVTYAAVPSSLLMGVTTFMSTDVAAVPLLWVLPLSLYLLTFVIVFATRTRVSHKWMVSLEPLVLLLAAFLVFWNTRFPAHWGVPLHLAVLFVVAMVCHGELARRRPPAAELTGFFFGDTATRRVDQREVRNPRPPHPGDAGCRAPPCGNTNRPESHAGYNARDDWPGVGGLQLQKPSTAVRSRARRGVRGGPASLGCGDKRCQAIVCRAELFRRVQGGHKSGLTVQDARARNNCPWRPGDGSRTEA